jgi:hypothetical protein
LVEIQKILNDSSINIQELLVKINEFEALHENIDALIAQIESDYKAADTAIESQITATDKRLSEGLATEIARAKGNETELANRLQSIETDYLKQVDKTEINAIIAGVGNVANAAKTAIDAFLNENAISDGVVNTLKEIQAELEAGEVTASGILNRVGELETKHATEIEAVRNEHKTDKDDLSNAINEIASQSETTFERFEEKHNEDITAVQKDIADMQTLVAE